jgi:hypothetical protein
MAQTSDEGCRFPVAKWCRADAGLLFGKSSIAPRHAARCPCLIDEYELLNFHARLRFKACLAGRPHVVALFLVCVQSL